MRKVRRSPRALVAVTLAAAAIVAGPVPAPAAVPTATAPSAPHVATQAAMDWQRTALRTVYAERGTAVPVGPLYLAFTSLAVRDATLTSLHRPRSSETAAIAAAAHGVLTAYFPDSRSGLDADLTTTLASVPDGQAERKGVRIGRRSASEIIEARDDDGRNDTTIVYRREAAPGVWVAPPTGMAAAWLGFVDMVLLDQPVVVDGPDRLSSAAYAVDFDEVMRLGSDASDTERTDEQTAIAQFFTANSVLVYRLALLDHLQVAPVSLRTTVDLFALADAATADTLIQAWRLKFDVGFWRPFQAIAGAETDRNPATALVPGWQPLVPNPPYADYTSGHAAATSSFAEAVRLVLGDDVSLKITGTGGAVRTYTSLSAVEDDALNARIWSGLHFRDAMEDGYRLGHVTARRIENRMW